MLLTLIVTLMLSIFSQLKSSLLGAVMLIILASSMGIQMAMHASKWMVFLTIFLFVGGMMVLFVYVCTLVSSFKHSITKNFMQTFLYKISLIFIMYMCINWMYIPIVVLSKTFIISILYCCSMRKLLMFSSIYLIMVLFISIKISQKYKGALKSNFNEK